MKPSGTKKIIDLTRSIAHGNPGVVIEQAKSLKEDGWNASTLHLYSHSGTHMDAPLHFEVGDQSIDQIPAERFMGRAWVIDMSPINAKQLIVPNDLGSVINKIEAGDSLLLRTGWSHHFGTLKYRDELPRISEELARWCGVHKINMLGVEPPSVADVNNIEEVTHIHEILLAADVIIVEGLVHLEQISSETVTLIALPLKIKNGDGAPARVIAIEN